MVSLPVRVTAAVRLKNTARDPLIIGEVYHMSTFPFDIKKK